MASDDSRTSPRSILNSDAPVAPLNLEIVSGSTKFPVRPVHGERFTLGAGTRCDLRLGGKHFPLLHSVIVIGWNEILLEQIATAPPLVVNGKPCSSAVLEDGDVIRIGGIELRARIPMSLSAWRAQANLRLVDEQVSPVEQAGFDRETVTASKLVDLLEETLGEAQAVQNGRDRGAQQLLAEVRQRQTVARVDAAEPLSGRGPHWNTARIPMDRGTVQETNADSPAQVDLLRKIDGLELEVARLSRHLKSLEGSRDGTTLAGQVRLTDLKKTKEGLLDELNGLFDRLDLDRRTQRRASA